MASKTRHKNTSNKDLVNPKTRVPKEHHDNSEESTYRQEESPQVSLLSPTTYKEQWQFNNKETSQWKIKQDPNSNYSKELYQQPSEQQNDPRLRRVIRSQEPRRAMATKSSASPEDRQMRVSYKKQDFLG